MNNEEFIVTNDICEENYIETTDSKEEKETTHKELDYWTTGEIGAMLGYNRQKVLEMINRYYRILLPYIGKKGTRNVIFKPDGAEIFKKLDALLKQGFTDDEEIESLLVNEAGEILSRQEPADIKMKRFVELMERETRSYINEVVTTIQETQAEQNMALVGMLKEQINSAQEKAELMKKEAELMKKETERLKEELHNIEIEKIKLQYEKEFVQHEKELAQQKAHNLEVQLEEKQKKLEKKSGLWGMFK